MNYSDVKKQVEEFTRTDDQYDYWSRLFNSQQPLRPNTIYMSRELFGDLMVYAPADAGAFDALERGCRAT